jgi:Na+/H+ antiporter NhaD and related arsenite permeases
LKTVNSNRLCNLVSINPVPVLMSTVIFSNIGGCITPVGDLPNVIIVNNKHFNKGVSIKFHVSDIFGYLQNKKQRWLPIDL